MEFLVYILYSETKDQYYVGQTSDIASRLSKHNKGYVRSTKSGRPWKCVLIEKYPSRSEACKRENEIKSKKKRAYICSLIENAQVLKLVDRLDSGSSVR